MILECIPNYLEAEAWAELAKEKGLVFEYNEFFNPLVLEDKEKIKEILHIYKSTDRDTSMDTVHGAFFDITVSSSDPLIRNASDYRVCQSIEAAEELSARGVVFHTNYLTDFKSIPYRDNWVDSNILYWTEKCAKHPEVNIFLENMFDDTPELLKRVAEGMKDVKNFGVCLDIAHAFLSKVPVYGWIDTLAGYIRHIHINDNDGCEDLHLAVGSGKIDWSLLKYEKLFELDPSVLIEVTGAEKLEASYDYLKTSGFIPAGL